MEISRSGKLPACPLKLVGENQRQICRGGKQTSWQLVAARHVTTIGDGGEFLRILQVGCRHWQMAEFAAAR
jgi:hypothetical protein